MNFKITPEVLAENDKQGPRYTSYPTAVEFNSDFGKEQFILQLKEADQNANTPLSLYIHIPFCKTRCSFCGCYTHILKNENQIEKYVDSLIREISLLKEVLKNRNKIAQLHLGGGTPSILSDNQIAKLLTKIKSSFVLTENGEVAIEVNPSSITLDKISFLKEQGFNRISFGVQDLDSNVLDHIGRPQTEEQIKSTFSHSKKLGFKSVNMDLIYGLPGQTVTQFENTIDKVIKISPDRVALYSFAYLPKIMSNQSSIKDSSLPKREDKFAMFASAYKKFMSQGYVQIGMDHFAKKDDDLSVAKEKGTLFRNFMGYTVSPHREMLGIGASSIGYINGAFYQNSKNLKEYESLINTNTLPVVKGYKLTDDDKYRQFVITSLMCNFKINYNDFYKQFKVNFEDYFKNELEELDKQRKTALPFTIKGDETLTATNAGSVFIRNICMTFDAYLKEKKGTSFSKTV